VVKKVNRYVDTLGKKTTGERQPTDTCYFFDGSLSWEM
jgi:hypothetical protein